MNLKSLGAGLTFRGKVKGQIQTYHVFEGEKFYFICSFSRTKRKAGNFNVVDIEAVRYVQRLAGGKQGVTSQDVHRRSRNPRLVGSALEALNILYVLVATGHARIDRRRKDKQLFFNVKKG
ncbi:MAG: hypothetical protein ACE5IQ_03245 [Candidatus Methylomirabilales bacterium]